MIYRRLLTIMILATTLIFFELTALAESHLSSRELKNKAVVERYFVEIVDRIGVEDADGDERQKIKAEIANVIGEIFHKDAVQHFPGWVPVQPEGMLGMIDGGSNKRMVTQIYHLIAERDLVAAYIHHDLTPHVDAMVPRFRVGCLFKSTGETISWDAMAIFKLSHGKIIEESIVRDDLGWVMALYGKEFPCVDKHDGPSPVPIPFGRKEE